MEAVSPKELVLIVPDQHEQCEADRKCDESLHSLKKLRERRRDFQRNDEEGDGKGKDGIRKAFDTSDLAAPPAKPTLSTHGFGDQKFSQHIFSCMHAVICSMYIESE